MAYGLLSPLSSRSSVSSQLEALRNRDRSSCYGRFTLVVVITPVAVVAVATLVPLVPTATFFTFVAFVAVVAAFADACCRCRRRNQFLLLLSFTPLKSSR